MAAFPDVAETLLPLILEFSPLSQTLHAAAVNSRWRTPARADQIWIPFCRSRWRFGALLGTSPTAAPGARDQASLEHLQRAATEHRKGSVSAEAFNFFQKRCMQDAEARSWLEQLSSSDNAQKKQARDQVLQRGADALDILLELERSPSSLQEAAKTMRQIISNKWAESKWIQLVKEPTQAATLEEGALVLSQWARPDADVAGMRSTLEKLASRAGELGAQRSRSSAPGLPTREEAEAMIQALNQTLFTEYGLVGNSTDYYNDENSLLHAVLSTKKGIPISLSVVWAALARRCNLPCHPLAGFPGHVLIRVPVRPESERLSFAEATDIYVDAFDGGQIMSWSGLSNFLRMRGARGVSEDQVREWVSILPPVHLYTRMIRNLANIYQQRRDEGRLSGIAQQMHALSSAA